MNNVSDKKLRKTLLSIILTMTLALASVFLVSNFITNEYQQKENEIHANLIGYLSETYDLDENEVIWCQIYDGDNVYDAAALPERWIQVDLNNFEESGDTGESGESGVPTEPEEPETPIEPEQPEEPETPNEWPEWIQPVGAQDAYNTGAQVSHNNLHWISIADNNVWEPGVYGWNEVTE